MSKFIGFDKDSLEEVFFRCKCLCTIGNFSYFINENDKECWIYLNIYSQDVKGTSSYIFNPKDLLELIIANEANHHYFIAEDAHHNQLATYYDDEVDLVSIDLSHPIKKFKNCKFVKAYKLDTNLYLTKDDYQKLIQELRKFCENLIDIRIAMSS